VTPDRLDCGLAAFALLLLLAIGLDYIESWWHAHINRTLNKEQEPFNGPWHNA
jgi:hypothetical protein